MPSRKKGYPIREREGERGDNNCLALNKPINLVKNGKSISFLAFIVITKPSEQLKTQVKEIAEKNKNETFEANAEASLGRAT